MSADAPSWLEGLTGTVADYASTALQLGNETAAGLATSLAGALARIQAMPAEAAAAVEELTGAIGALFPDETAVSPNESPLQAAPIASAACPPAAGSSGGFGGSARVVPQVVPRGVRIDAAAFALFIRRQHPHKAVENAAALTGIPVDTMEKMLKRETLPSGPNFLLCVVAYGPALIAAVLPEAEERWLIGAQILADQARLEAELAATLAARAANTERWSFCGIGFGALA